MQMNRFKRAILVTICLTGSTSALYASPAQLATVKEYLELSHTEEMLRSSVTDLDSYYDQQAEQTILSLTGSPVLNAQEQQAAIKLSQLFKETNAQIFNSPETQKVIQDVYLKTYSEEELQAYIRFLKTPEGHSIAMKDVGIMKELSKYLSHLTQSVLEPKQFQEKMNVILAPLFKNQPSNANN